MLACDKKGRKSGSKAIKRFGENKQLAAPINTFHIYHWTIIAK